MTTATASRSRLRARLGALRVRLAVPECLHDPWRQRARLDWDRRAEDGELGAVLDGLQVDPAASVLEVGCGGGALACALARRLAPAGRVVGIDVDRRSVQLATARAGRLGVANVCFVHADVLGAPAPLAGRFDLVLSRSALMYMVPAGRCARYLDALRVMGRGAASIALVEPDVDWADLGEPLPAGLLGYVMARLEAYSRDRWLVDWRSGRDLARHLGGAGCGSAAVRRLVDHAVGACQAPVLAAETTRVFEALAGSYLRFAGLPAATPEVVRLWRQWLTHPGMRLRRSLVLATVRAA